MGDRIQRLTPMSSRLASAIVTHDGEKLFFLSAFEKGYDLWETKIRERSTKLLKKLGGGSAALELDKKGDNLFIFAGSSIKKMAVKGGEPKNVVCEPSMNLNRTKEREYMFNHVFTQQEKRFYNTNYHGVDLKQLQKDYRPFLEHITNNYDFAEMLSEILGELNVSHTGSSYIPPRQANADIMLLFLLSPDKSVMAQKAIFGFNKTEAQLRREAGIASKYSQASLIKILSVLRTFDARSKGIDNEASEEDLYKELVYKILH